MPMTELPVVLLTGFDPFAGEAVNASWEVAAALHGRRIDGHRLVAARLPTVFEGSRQRVRELLRRHRPALVVCLGQASGRAAISLERVALNLNDAKLADNAQARPIDTPVIPGGPTAYFSSLPLKAMYLALQDAGIPVEVSHTAGTFVCNHVFYVLMHELGRSRRQPRPRGGLIHLPWLAQQGTPHLSLATQVQGVEVALTCALRTLQDVQASTGTLC